MGHLPDARFGRVLTAMVTPFSAEGALDLDEAQSLARWLVTNGSDGLVVNGTTGEAPTLTAAESRDLFAAVREAVDAPVVAGTGSNDTAHAIAQSKAAAAVGVDGLLVVTPYYNRPSQTGLDAHFRAVAGATGLPVILYDIPGRTGRKIDSDVIARLALEVDNIVALKDAAGDPAATTALIAEVGDHLQVYSGDDSLTLALLAGGAVGVIGVATHWAGPEMADLVAAVDRGDLSEARRINGRLTSSYEFENSAIAPNPLPAKAMLRTLGRAVGQCRPPVGPTPPGLEDEARRIMAELRP